MAVPPHPLAGGIPIGGTPRGGPPAPVPPIPLHLPQYVADGGFSVALIGDTVFLIPLSGITILASGKIVKAPTPDAVVRLPAARIGDLLEELEDIKRQIEARRIPGQEPT